MGTAEEGAKRPTAKWIWLFFLVLALLVLLIRMFSLWNVGQERLVLAESFWRVVALASIFGALGGLAFDIAEPLRPPPKRNPDAFDNRTAVPHFERRRGGGTGNVVDWGYLGPMIVGSVAALAAVFILGIDRETAPVDPAQPATAAAGPTFFIEPHVLIFIALVAGFAGPVFLRTARSRVIGLLENAKLATTATVAVADVGDEAQDLLNRLQASSLESVERLERKAEQVLGDPQAREGLLLGLIKEEVSKVREELTNKANKAREELGTTRRQALQSIQDSSSNGNPAPEDV